MFRLLYGSANSSIDSDDHEKLIQHYHFELVKYLKLMKFTGRFPTLLEIQIEAYRTDFYNAMICLFITGLRYLTKSFNGGFIEVANDEQTDENDHGKLYSHPECIKKMKVLLNIFDRRGFFDFK